MVRMPTAGPILALLVALTPNLRSQSASDRARQGAAPTDNAAKSMQAVMENVAEEQRKATLSAMQAALSKQHSSLAAARTEQAGKEMTPQKIDGPALDSFFLLPPPSPLAERLTAPAAPLAQASDVACEPAPHVEITPLVRNAAQREGLDPNLLTLIIEQESAYRPCAVSQKGALGIMQLMPDTTEAFDVKDPFDPRQNIDAGAKYLKQLLTRYGGDLGKTLAAFNAGPAKVDEAGGVPQIAETTAYVNEILQKLHALAAPSEPVAPVAPKLVPPAPTTTPDQ